MPIPKGMGARSPMLQLCKYSTWLQGHADPTEIAHKKGLCKRGPHMTAKHKLEELLRLRRLKGGKEELKGTV